MDRGAQFALLLANSKMSVYIDDRNMDFRWKINLKVNIWTYHQVRFQIRRQLKGMVWERFYRKFSVRVRHQQRDALRNQLEKELNDE